MTKSILIMAGGTGGHIFPGLAVAEELKNDGWKVHWLGAKGKMEENIIPQHDIPISLLNISALRGKGIINLLTSPFKILRAIGAAIKVINETKPDVILGMGGFTAGPGGVAGWLKGIPIVLHEQNAIPGMTNRLLSFFASRVLTGFDNTFNKAGSSKYSWVGNPIRSQIQPRPLHFKITHSTQPCHVLIVGGSLGSRPLNNWVPKAFSQLDSTQWQVRHQCGRGNKQQVAQDYQNCINTGLAVQIDEFIDDMFAAYEWADVVICRAGALTVSELAMIGRPAIFVPLPHAVDDHQTFNAKYLVGAKAAKLLPQSELENDKLSQMLSEITHQPETLQQMSIAAVSVAKPNATKQVADICHQLARGQQ